MLEVGERPSIDPIRLTIIERIRAANMPPLAGTAGKQSLIATRSVKIVTNH